MKDRQIQKKLERGYIPLLSWFLHVGSMPFLVMFRRGLGLGFLRPKSIFLALIWCLLLFSIYSYFRPETWKKEPVLFLLWSLASVLYLIHLATAAISQFGKPDHDQALGVQMFLIGRIPLRSVRLWLEPGIVLILGLLAHILLDSSVLPAYLFASAGCLWTKEFLNRWFRVRKQSRKKDAFEDAGEELEVAVETTEIVVIESPIETTRKERQKRKRVR